jgi:prophage regulatory protein
MPFSSRQDHALSTFWGMAELVPMGPEEIRLRLNVSRQRAYILIGRRDFPEPWVELAMGKVWRSTDVERYAAEREKRLHASGADDENDA